jgi:hypothetical protein
MARPGGTTSIVSPARSSDSSWSSDRSNARSQDRGQACHPDLVLELARLGEMLLDARTPQGLERLRRNYSE